MFVLITGGSGSGKSAYGEKTVVSLANKLNDPSLYYIATMQVYGEEGRKKVERHRILRAGKGFETIEQPVNILEALENMKSGNKIVLLECMSNLVANEMFSGELNVVEDVVDKICRSICSLRQKTNDLIIVTNNVFEDGIDYEIATKSYMEALGRINTQLAAMADAVTEVVAGIPVPVKGELIKYD
ncbi:bifunctional adenosylcobinamide kinase/adenosylcobinamide-phosphate guanylyltransferase [Anaerocolumna aminovalerica]|jgi:adenosylcobinamide kinase/adenosylcobinamide-phosphate guanylyltransferase|uniref:Adenosylcobinamide kinase n=1 Tax=Anaerocolumna aminovalerica TaxID=1527 RepID=A0A1I5E8C1_9FIRM|nr:bifunctional adenosylcobinamide kinase/adenosylcobinamide-phosphate guanylyltransferase [Anaerocolumna aminovalerica]MBU5330760.1 bifunctional adenosylcobinamide kinase/adenosylcobinamide-phosphate guanylyltransferase [Anaerocolumna aminovalerica]MDU6263330.1 bifunctional adenosylcobinamide kinase/adenosylcobinamide-phosphate guanylyltransferase [Anaerocolumna aminovalerica]SFO07878.1 adenosylcobinamide kinase /adenosylcobinamide-phosphate guanylyltransferase [Anaerocolumna aminovalerica]